MPERQPAANEDNTESIAESEQKQSQTAEVPVSQMQAKSQEPRQHTYSKLGKSMKTAS